MKCFERCMRNDTTCKKSDCRYWIEYESGKNCTLIAARSGPLTLQEIGDIFSVTRMRICQIEKRILKKIENYLKT
tara:strand:- start:742 stop:966 length:225 start_codon:yes stop_codon:yes gene_type:complete